MATCCAPSTPPPPTRARCFGCTKTRGWALATTSKAQLHLFCAVCASVRSELWQPSHKPAQSNACTSLSHVPTGIAAGMFPRGSLWWIAPSSCDALRLPALRSPAAGPRAPGSENATSVHFIPARRPAIHVHENHACASVRGRKHAATCDLRHTGSGPSRDLPSTPFTAPK